MSSAPFKPVPGSMDISVRQTPLSLQLVLERQIHYGSVSLVGFRFVDAPPVAKTPFSSFADPVSFFLISWDRTNEVVAFRHLTPAEIRVIAEDRTYAYVAVEGLATWTSSEPLVFGIGATLGLREACPET